MDLKIEPLLFVLCLGTPQNPLGGAGKCCWEGGLQEYPAKPAKPADPATCPRIIGRQRMNG